MSRYKRGYGTAHNRVLDFMVDFIEKNHTAPTFREVAEGLDLRSVGTVAKHVDTLEKLGLVRRLGGGKSRGAVPVSMDKSER